MATLKKAEKEKTGFVAMLYQLAPRAYLAIILDKINIDDFVEKAPEAAVLDALGLFLSMS